MNTDEIREKVRSLVQSLSKPEQDILHRVIQLEKEKLYLDNPKFLVDDIEEIVRRAIK